MLVNPFAGVVNSALSGARNTTSKIQEAVAQLASGRRVNKASQDVASLSVATQLQNQISGLRTALGNSSLAVSQLQVADNDIGQIQNILGRLKEIATQSNSGGLDDSSRKALDVEFQGLAEEVSRLASTSSFNGKTLLDGSLSGSEALSINGVLGEGSVEDDVALEIESLTANDIFGAKLNVRTQASAEEALNAIQQAFNTVGTARASVGSFLEQIDYASAAIETAISNQEAARSELSDADFATAATALSQANLQRDVQIAASAQAKRLPPSMLELIG